MRMTKASSRNRLWDVLRHLAFILQKAVFAGRTTCSNSSGLTFYIYFFPFSIILSTPL